MSYRFSVELTKNPKQKPDPDSLRFGTVFTDHMIPNMAGMTAE